MKTKNNLTTGILIGIGVIVLPLILMSSSSTSPTNNEITYVTPESHVWKSTVTNEGRYYLHNTKTGEVRKFSRSYPGGGSDKNISSYVTMSERE